MLTRQKAAVLLFLFVSQACAAAAEQPGIERVLGALRTGTGSHCLVLTENDLNEYVLKTFLAPKPGAIKSLAFDFRANGIVGTVLTLDLDKARDSSFAKLARVLMAREARVKLEGVLEINGEKARYKLESVWVNGVRMPAWFVSTLIAHASKRQAPYMDITEGFYLPYGVRDVRIRADRAEIIR